MKEIEIASQLKLPRKQLNVDDIMGKSSSKYSSLKQIPSYLIFVPHDKGFTVNPQKTWSVCSIIMINNHLLEVNQIYDFFFHFQTFKTNDGSWCLKIQPIFIADFPRFLRMIRTHRARFLSYLKEDF